MAFDDLKQKQRTMWGAGSLEPDRREELHGAFVEFFERYPSDNGGIRQPRPYLIALGTRR
ncbi:MAG: hypothetical protein ACRDM2_09780 [Gaiellaceae bacterium]